MKLITCATGAEAYKLKAVLAGEILLGDYKELPQTMLSSGKMLQLPNPVDAAYPHKMLALSLDKGITEIYALAVEEQLLLKESRQLFEEYNIIIKG